MNPPQQITTSSSRHRRHRSSLRHSKNPRLMGAFFLVIGGVLLYLCEILPVITAQQHLSVLGGKFSAKGTVVGFTCFIFGFALIIGGGSVLRFMNPESYPASKASKVVAYILAFLSVAGGIALHFWTRAYLESLGYSFMY
jgi:hypothetical protein